LPVSWLEAMAMEKPIVASNIGWATEVIEDGKEGFLVHPTNHEQYAQCILELLDDTSKQKQFGKAAREKVLATFSMETVAKQSVTFYSQLIH
jgi:starch synthase